ncbi:MAG: GNAT family N-acetyltransferase [Legionellaceae bacterium]|nr:GNAT family N-acetyltransferase [Legionellaceae bacterium]
MITNTHQLSQTTLSDLQALLDTCQKTDGASIPIYAHLLEAYRPGPPSFLCYKNDQLIAFLAAFHFYPDAAEISLLVHPNHRRKGIAKELWNEMCQAIRIITPPLTHLIVSSPHASNKTWFKQYDFQFDHTEYDMSCTPYISNLPPPPNYTIREATPRDVNLLHNIDRACFNPNRPEAIQRIKKLLTTANIKVFLMFHNTELVGQVHLVFETAQVRLTDLAVLPHMQQQGFGQALLTYCLKYAYAKQQQTLSLTVASKNQHALRLYQNVGFQIYNAVDYHKWGCRLTDFERAL